jgi:hypothetical protein
MDWTNYGSAVTAQPASVGRRRFGHRRRETPSQTHRRDPLKFAARLERIRDATGKMPSLPRQRAATGLSLF